MRTTIHMTLLLLFLSVTGCHQNKLAEKPISQEDIWDCYNGSEWTAGKISEELRGSWQWIYTENYWGTGTGWSTNDKDTYINFLSDSTLSITIEGEIRDTTGWQLVQRDFELFGIHLDSAITDLLYGRILLCGDLLEMNNSYIDGGDNYFSKVE